MAYTECTCDKHPTRLKKNIIALFEMYLSELMERNL